MKGFNVNTSNCLDCIYEPKWGKPVLNHSKSIEHVLGDRGVNFNCPAWQGMEDGNG